MSGATSAAVVGGGIGGLTAALALARAGCDVRVHEQAGTVSELGAGIQLAPNCTGILRELGLLAEVARVAVEPEAIEFRRWDDARLLSRTPLGAAVERAYGAPYLHVHRGDLMWILVDALPDRVEVRRRCVGVSHRGDAAEVHFADGTSTVADVVVGADGIHSVVRGSLFGPEDARFTGHVAYRGLVPADRVADLALPRRCTIRLGPGAHFVHYYVGSGSLLNVVCVLEERSWTRESWTDPGDPDELRAAFRGWHPTVRAIVDAMAEPLKWALFDRPPLPRWGAGAVALLGDACHPMLPYSAQGAAQAIEDAAALAACLATRSGHGVAAALADYATRRHERASRVADMSRDSGIRFHLPDGPQQRARDEAMASGYGIAPDIDWLYSRAA